MLRSAMQSFLPHFSDVGLGEAQHPFALGLSRDSTLIRSFDQAKCGHLHSEYWKPAKAHLCGIVRFIHGPSK